MIQAPPCQFGPQPTLAMGLNSSGAVVGYYCCDCKFTQAFAWTADGGLSALAMPPGTLSSEAWDINDQGWTTGWTIPTSLYGALAFVHDGGQAFPIYPPGGATFSQALALNNQGRVVGTAGDGATPYFKAFYWEKGTMTLIQPTFGPRSAASDVAEDGQIVGWMGLAQEIDGHPFLWNDGTIVDLGVLPGAYSGMASAIGGSGDVAGKCWLPNPDGPGFVVRATLWSDGQVVDLGTLPGYARSQSLGINSFRQVVGNCSHPDPNDWRAFLWENGVMYDLNDLIPPNAGILLTVATAINDAGQVTCWAGDVAALLTPRPRPPGDLDGDCTVGVLDLLALLAAWGPCPPYCLGDIDGDCDVKIVDLLLLLAHWS